LTTALPYLDEVAVLRLAPWADAVAAIERVLLDGLDPADVPQRSFVDVAHGQVLLMPGVTPTGVGVKLATVAPGNPDLGLPRIQAVYALFDPVTLAVTALLDGTALTAVRTPAVSAAAVKHLAVPSAHRLVVFGSGPQAWGHVEAVRAVRPIDEVVVVARRAAGAEVLARRITASGTDARAGVPGDVATADVVACATTARSPLFDGALLPAHACVVAVGSHEPEARELDAVTLQRAGRVVVEDAAVAMREAGDVIQAVASGDLAEADLIGLKDAVGLKPDGGGSVFKSVGMGWQDLAVAELVHRGWTEERDA
jgi:ornithine cyclodeaminase/alanine dehydrogenase-like protein (mu-crystallin family)